MDTYNNIFDVDNDTKKPPTDGPEYQEDLLIRKLQGRWTQRDVRSNIFLGRVPECSLLVYDYRRRQDNACCRTNAGIHYSWVLQQLKAANWYEHEFVRLIENEEIFLNHYDEMLDWYREEGVII